MSNFSDYINDCNNKEINSSKESVCKISEEELKNKIDEYSSYSSENLMNEFIRLTNEKKQRGELDDSELEKLKNTISPMLNNEQKNNLDKLLKMVKDVK